MTETNEEISFDSLDMVGRIAVVDQRIGDQPDRIKSPKELMDFHGKTMYMVVSPFGETQDIGTCFLWEWSVGKIQNQYGDPITEDDEIDLSKETKYLVLNFNDGDQQLSIRDFNIIPNDYNNHCAFTNREAAESYMLYRKLQFQEDDTLIQAEGKYPHHVTVEDLKKAVEIEEKLKSQK